jgi:glycyl-tRNA synthetase beta chain
MADTATLLVEIGTEELPPKALSRLSGAFRDGLVSGLDKAGLAHGPARALCSPRRLAVQVEALATAQPDRVEERRGPALTAAYDADGEPTKAALGFARSCGREVGELERLETDKGTWLVARREVAGQPAAALLPALVEAALAGLPIPKRMRWGDRDEEFVRPVHWVVLLLDSEIVPGRVLGHDTVRTTRGHRFHCDGPLDIADASDYVELLRDEGQVLVDFAGRRDTIREQVEAVAGSLGGHAVIEAALLDEVTALVEWPVALAGSFEARFLDVPAEALISTMQGNQKYFPVVGDDGSLLPHFITVSNIASRHPETVRRGNERVIRPRFADAQFFWDQDRKQTLTDRVPRLANVVFQERLGTLHDRAERISMLAALICERTDGDPGQARLAGRLAKCDLLTDMVGEFPELQGTMGRYYALNDGLPEAVAVALEEQYLPRFAGDTLPATPAGRAVALADKLDLLVGIFGIGQRPSGDRDPYGLRRAALGVLRIVLEGELELDLAELVASAAASLDGRLSEADTEGQVLQFLFDRLRGHYLDAGFTPDLFEAVVALRPTRPLDFDRRLRAVAAFRELPEAESLAAANKRVRNILRQAEAEQPSEPDLELLTEPAERDLAEQLASHAAAVEPDLAMGDYQAALGELAGLRPAVDRFFDEVMVMADDPAVRANRLALLGQMSTLFLRVADLSRLQS